LSVPAQTRSAAWVVVNGELGYTSGVKSARPDSLARHFLIAEPELADPNFIKTVVLLSHHSENGAFGLVLNRRTELVLGGAVPRLADHAVGSYPMFIGGPVQQEYLFVLHSGLDGRRSDNSVELAAGLVFEPDFSLVEEYLRNEWDELRPADQPELRFMAGYSGWGEGQLEGELDQRAWTWLAAEAGVAFQKNHEDIWKEALRRKGGVYWALAQTGYKPSLN
jgi:putative transcriptional regulator